MSLRLSASSSRAKRREAPSPIEAYTSAPVSFPHALATWLSSVLRSIPAAGAFCDEDISGDVLLAAAAEVASLCAPPRKACTGPLWAAVVSSAAQSLQAPCTTTLSSLTSTAPSGFSPVGTGAPVPCTSPLAVSGPVRPPRTVLAPKGTHVYLPEPASLSAASRAHRAAADAATVSSQEEVDDDQYSVLFPSASTASASGDTSSSASSSSATNSGGSSGGLPPLPPSLAPTAPFWRPPSLPLLSDTDASPSIPHSNGKSRGEVQKSQGGTLLKFLSHTSAAAAAAAADAAAAAAAEAAAEAAASASAAAAAAAAAEIAGAEARVGFVRLGECIEAVGKVEVTARVHAVTPAAGAGAGRAAGLGLEDASTPPRAAPTAAAVPAGPPGSASAPVPAPVIVHRRARVWHVSLSRPLRLAEVTALRDAWLAAVAAAVPAAAAAAAAAAAERKRMRQDMQQGRLKAQGQGSLLTFFTRATGEMGDDAGPSPQSKGQSKGYLRLLLHEAFAQWLGLVWEPFAIACSAAASTSTDGSSAVAAAAAAAAAGVGSGGRGAAVGGWVAVAPTNDAVSHLLHAAGASPSQAVSALVAAWGPTPASASAPLNASEGVSVGITGELFRPCFAAAGLPPALAAAAVETSTSAPAIRLMDTDKRPRATQLSLEQCLARLSLSSSSSLTAIAPATRMGSMSGDD